MKVLWLCNIMLPAVAEHFHRESSNKEGWLSGLLTAVLSHGDSNGIELAVGSSRWLRDCLTVRKLLVATQ